MATKLAIEVSTPGFKLNSKTLDLVNQTFGRLTVLSLAGYSKDRRAVWLCRCSCGNTKLIRHRALMSKTKSCGCLLKEVAKSKTDKINAKFERSRATLNMIYCNYQYSTAKRGHSFELTWDEFYELIISNCYYCSRPPTQSRDKKFNGIDRKDNTLGYILGNVVPCCITCNKAKASSSLDEFKEYIKQVYETTYITRKGIL